MKTRTVYSGDHVVSEGLLVACGTAEVVASGTATVILFDKAVCVASGKTHVTARGDNNVHISEEAEADVGGGSHLEAYGGSFTLRGRANGFVMGECSGFVLEKASVTALGNANLVMMSEGELHVSDGARVLYTPNRLRGGAIGRCLELTGSGVAQLAQTLHDMQAGKNSERGVSCVRTIVDELRRGDITGALAVANNESDKIRSYADIVGVLKEAGFWYEIDWSRV